MVFNTVFICIIEGICQSYVSRYMKGDLFDMSERSRRAIQKWYLIYRKNPAAIGQCTLYSARDCNTVANICCIRHFILQSITLF